MWRVGDTQVSAVGRSLVSILYIMISINRQWRVCFEWHEGNAFGVEITDYH